MYPKTKPNTASIGKFLTLSGDMKGLFKFGSLSRRYITDKFVNINDPY